MPVRALKKEDGYRAAGNALADAPETEKSKSIPPLYMYGGCARLFGVTFRFDTLLICAMFWFRQSF
jgi:hypothetical protein